MSVQDEINEMIAERTKLWAKVGALTTERDALRAALELYAKHLASCEWPRACTCGLDQALAGQPERAEG